MPRDSPAGFMEYEWIARSPTDVFRAATDLAHAQEWMPDLVDIEPLDEEPLHVGYRWRETRRLGRRHATSTIEIVELHGPDQGEAPFRYAARSDAMGIDALYRYTFTPDGEGTEVRLEAEVRPRNLLARLLVPMIVRAMESADGDQLQRLKEALESG